MTIKTKLSLHLVSVVLVVGAVPATSNRGDEPGQEVKLSFGWRLSEIVD